MASRKTAFHPKLAAMTDRWMDLFGYLAPSVVSDTAEEYRACREAAALMDFSMLRKVDIEGQAAVDFVNSVVTRDLTRLAPRRIAYGALTDEHGKMVDDCTCMIRSPSAVRFCGANDRDHAIFSALAEGSPITVTEQTDALPHLCLQGPESRHILERLTSADMSAAAFPYYTFREDVEIAGIPVFMTRLGYTAELGYELWVERSRCLELWDALIDAGTPAGMRVIGMDALDLFRVEGGFIIGGVEYDPTVSPYECGLGWSVELDKDDFQGREALARDRDVGAAAAHKRRARLGRGLGEWRSSRGGWAAGGDRHPGGRVTAPSWVDARPGQDPEASDRARHPRHRPNRRRDGRRRGRSAPCVRP